MNINKRVTKLFFASLIILSIACGQFTSGTKVPLQPAKATQAPIITEAVTTLEATQAPKTTPQATVAEVTFGAVAREHITAITEQFGARWTGTEQETKTAQYIKEEFTKMGYEPEVKPFSREGWVDDQTQAMFNSANVVAVKQGDSNQVIVVGAHYDSSDEGLGADDNASGTGAVLELAKILKDVPTPYTIHFVAFGGEEAGLLGSQEYVDKLSPEEIENTVGFVNLDSIIAGDIIYVYGNESKPALRDWALDWAGKNGFDLQTIKNVDLKDDGYGTGDNDAFEKVGIPFAYFEATNWTLGDKDGYTQVNPQYGDDGAIIHTQYDNLKYLDETFPGRVNQRLNSFITILYNLLTQYSTGN
jgi:alkaline phosphatase isozyme conversion protein